MKCIRIGFSRSNGIIARLIRKVQKTPYNHAFIMGMNGKIAQADARGVTFKDTAEDLNILFAFHKSVSDERYKDIMNYLTAQIGDHYQYISLFKILFNLPLRDDGSKRFICSELVARACYEELGYESSEAALDDVTPLELYDKVKDWNDKKI